MSHRCLSDRIVRIEWLLGPLLIALLLFVVSCQRQKTVCPDDSITYVSDPAAMPLLNASDGVGPIPTPASVEIGGKMKEVDRVVRGPVCNDVWRDTVYVGCDIQIMEWVEDVTFFEQCDLTVELGSIVYVAAHNDTAYYKGCSCHTGELNGE